jgi:UPF0758 N-terminal
MHPLLLLKEPPLNYYIKRMPLLSIEGTGLALPSPLVYPILAKTWGDVMDALSGRRWQHPGGKLRELGAKNLTDAELLAILISAGIKGKPAERIAEELLARFGSFKKMANQPLKKFLDIKGLGAVKIHRIAAALEIARRMASQGIRDEK